MFYMLYYYIILFLSSFTAVFVPTFSMGQEIHWDESEYTFKDITEGEKVQYTFTFKNTGTEPLIINQVAVVCGCTTPKGWPRDPVEPGKKGSVTVSFDTKGKSGHQRKVISIVSNAKKGDSKIVMEGDILPQSQSKN